MNDDSRMFLKPKHSIGTILCPCSHFISSNIPAVTQMSLLSSLNNSVPQASFATRLWLRPWFPHLRPSQAHHVRCPQTVVKLQPASLSYSCNYLCVRFISVCMLCWKPPGPLLPFLLRKTQVLNCKNPAQMQLFNFRLQPQKNGCFLFFFSQCFMPQILLISALENIK